jgi:hypothetical protein
MQTRQGAWDRLTGPSKGSSATARPFLVPVLQSLDDFRVTEQLRARRDETVTPAGEQPDGCGD